MHSFTEFETSLTMNSSTDSADWIIKTLTMKPLGHFTTGTTQAGSALTLHLTKPRDDVLTTTWF